MSTATQSPPSTAVPLLELTYHDQIRVDQQAGVIHGVKILGRQSRNARVYSDAALEQAAELYEGIGVNIDHPDERALPEQRKLWECFGHLQNVRKQQDGVYGDLVFLRSHSMANQICEAAERMPSQLGLSHNAEGVVSHHDGQAIVESITKIHSVDLVRNPATNNGLFESTDFAGLVETSTGETTGESGISADEQLTEDRHSPSYLLNCIERLQEEVAELRTELDVRKLLEANGIDIDDGRVDLFKSRESDEERQRLLQSWLFRAAPKPRSSELFRESFRRSKLPDDAGQFARMIS